MCSISGSSNLEKAYNLYVNGLDRGSYSSGVLLITKNNPVVIKQQQVFSKNYIEEISNKHNAIYWAFHSRAPTNVVLKEWNEEDNHPFMYENYYVSHNGIISNFNTFEDNEKFKTDTSIIPYHIHKYNGNILYAYSKYKGLITSWIYDANSRKFYLTKAGSSLYIYEDCFSTVCFEKSEPVIEDGILLMLKNYTSFEKQGTFEYKNPYFLI